MNTLNRVLILLLLGILMYALYRYQEQLMSYTSFESDKKKKPIVKMIKNKPTNKNDDITIDNVSQFSIRSEENSLLDTAGESHDGLSFLESNTHEDEEQFFRD